MVNVSRSAFCLVAALATAGCTLENSGVIAGVSGDDGREIVAMVRARTGGDVASFGRQPNGDVIVWMRVDRDPRFPYKRGSDESSFHGYIVRRVQGKWKVVDETVLEI